jgi:CheY-like chemotaxis protein
MDFSAKRHRLRYTVVEAANGAEALETLREEPKIEILFTDIVMPGGLDGFELAHQAKQLRPDLRVVYTSGFIKEIPWGEKGLGYGPLLPKPWRRDQLVQVIQSVVRDGGDTTAQQ